MEINASSTLGSAASTDQSIRLANEETNKEKPSAAQDKSPSSPSSAEVSFSNTGLALSTRAEASEESDVENSPEQGQEATKSAEATRLQTNSEEETTAFSPKESIAEFKQATQQNPGAVISAQANASGNDVASLFSN